MIEFRKLRLPSVIENSEFSSKRRLDVHAGWDVQCDTNEVLLRYELNFA
jgi:hypothetical protein